MQKHFVTFLSPGSFVSEQSSQPVPAWDITTAVKLARNVKERHGATPYAFYFTTRGRGHDDLDSRETDRSPLYYLGGKIETLEEIIARDLPDERILRENMRCNGWARVIRNENSWRVTMPLNDTDVVLDFVP